MTKAIRTFLFGIAVQGMVLAAPQGWKTLDFKTATASEIRPLLAAGASPNAKDKGGKTPLHMAAWRGNLEAVQVLLDARANPKAKDKRGKTPLHWAADGGHAEVVQALLAAGAQ